MCGVAEAAASLGDAILAAGEPDGALRLLAEATTVATDIGSHDLLPRVRLSLGEALVEVGRVVEAWEAATAALGAEGGLDRDERSRAHTVRARALEATGGTDA